MLIPCCVGYLRCQSVLDQPKGWGSIQQTPFGAWECCHIGAWSPQWESNPRPSAYKADALAAELWRRRSHCAKVELVLKVGLIVDNKPVSPETSKWMQIVAQNPAHSSWYIERFRQMAAAGNDLAGEARMINAMVPRASRILDAGCGPGRVGGELHKLGHQVVGVDVDPELIAAAEVDHPGPEWVVGDLAELSLGREFDAIVCAGNVVGFLAPSTRVDVLRGFASHLAEDGRAVIGFGGGRGYEFSQFFSDVTAAGLELELALSTWDLRPFTAESNFLVAVCGLPKA